MPKNTVTQQFREGASDEEWKQLVADHEALSDDEFKAKYNFSWSSIMQDAADRGHYVKKRNHSSTPKENPEDGPEDFFIPRFPADVKKLNRSFQVKEDVYERLKKLINDNGQYPAFAIFNQVLDDGLKKYGY